MEYICISKFDSKFPTNAMHTCYYIETELFYCSRHQIAKATSMLFYAVNVTSLTSMQWT